MLAKLNHPSSDDVTSSFLSRTEIGLNELAFMEPSLLPWWVALMIPSILSDIAIT